MVRCEAEILHYVQDDKDEVQDDKDGVQDDKDGFRMAGLIDMMTVRMTLV
jgi:hypothetical protein